MEIPAPRAMSSAVFLATVAPDFVRESRSRTPVWSEDMVGAPHPYGVGVECKLDGVHCVHPAVYVSHGVDSITGAVRRRCWYVERAGDRHAALWVGRRRFRAPAGYSGGVADGGRFGFRLQLEGRLVEEAITELPSDTYVSLPGPLALSTRMRGEAGRARPDGFDVVLEV